MISRTKTFTLWDHRATLWKCLIEISAVFRQTEASHWHWHLFLTQAEVDEELQDPLNCSLGLWGWHHLLLKPCYCNSLHLPLSLMFGDRQGAVGGNCEWRWCKCFRKKKAEMQNEAEGVWQVSGGLCRHWSMSRWRQRRMLSWHTTQLIGLFWHFLKLPSIFV